LHLFFDTNDTKSFLIKNKALGVFLFWLRTNNTQEIIGSLFSIEHQEVSRYCEQVRDGLLRTFVPNNLGINPSMTRNDWLEHNTELAKELVFTNSSN